MVSSTLLNNMMNPTRANAGQSYREGGDHALAKRILEANKLQQAQSHESDLETARLNQEGKRFSNSQAPIIAGERTATHESDLKTADLNQKDQVQITRKRVDDILYNKSDREKEDFFQKIALAKSIGNDTEESMAQQNIIYENMINDMPNNPEARTVLKYLRMQKDPAGVDKINNEIIQAGYQSEYLKEPYSIRTSSARPTNLGSYMAAVREDYMNKNDGKEPPAGFMVAAQERFQKISGSQAYERKYGTETGGIDAKLTPKADELRETENIAEANKASGVDTAKATVKTIDEIHDSIATTNSTIDNLTGIEEAIDDGAITGWASKFAPSLRAATLKLQNHAHRLGLDVIASVTFGALSEAELRLAMETAVPTDMAPQDLKKWVINKKAAMKKMLREQQKMVIFLENKNPETGVRNTRTDWLRRNEALRAKAEQENPEITNPTPKVDPNKSYDKPKQQHLNFYYNNPNNLPQEELDRFFIDKFGKLPPAREVI